MSKQNRSQGRAQRAAAIRAEQERKERNRRIGLIVGIVVLLGAIVAAGAWYSSGGSNKPTDTVATPPLAVGDHSLLMGKSDAPVKVVVYEDFLCPVCREFELSSRDAFREDAIKGKVQVEYRPINLLAQYAYSAKSLNTWAAVLNHSTPKAAWKLHDLLYDDQPYEQSSDQVTDSQIASWVAKSGGDNAAVRDAMKTQDTAFLTAVGNAMTAAKVDSTPTVFVNGTKLPLATVPQMIAQIQTAIDQGSK